MNQELNNRIIALVWILISPILWIIAAISTVESIMTYYIQFIFFSIFAILGLVSGIASLFKLNWAYAVLKYLSWIAFILFSGSGVAMLVYGIPVVIKGNFKDAVFIFPIAIGVVCTGLPFYAMARKLSGKAIF